MINDPLQTFAKRIRQLRKQNKLSSEQFCEAFNKRFDAKLNKSTVSKYENGLQEPMLNTIRKFAEFYDVEPEYLLGFDLDRENLSETEIFAENVALLLQEEKIELRGLILDLMKLNEDQVKAIRAVVSTYL